MEREQWLENVRATACLMVIVVHVTAITKNQYGNIEDIYWYITVILDSATRMCVPLFFMISGYIFLSHKTVKIKNIVKIFAALTFYSVLCVAYLSYFRNKDFFLELITIYQKPALYHMWYMFYIFAFYILLMVIDVRKIPAFSGLIIVTLVMTLFNKNVSDITSFLFGYSLNNYFYINSIHLQLFMYCLAGFFIGSINDRGGFIKIAYASCFLSISVIVAFTIIKSIHIGRLDTLFQNYNTIPVYFSAISAFYILKNTNFKKILIKSASYISDKSLAIYGLHAIIFEIIRSKQYFFFSNPLANLASTYAIVLFFSIAGSSVIRFFDKSRYVS